MDGSGGVSVSDGTYDLVFNILAELERTRDALARLQAGQGTLPDMAPGVPGREKVHTPAT